MKRLIVAALALLGIANLGHTGASAAAPATAAEVDAAFKREFLAGNLDAFFELFAPTTVGRNLFAPFASRDELRAIVGNTLASSTGFSATMSETTVVGDTAVHRFTVSTDQIRAAGINRLAGTHTLVVVGGVIIAFVEAPDLSDDETARFLAAMAGS